MLTARVDHVARLRTALASHVGSSAARASSLAPVLALLLLTASVPPTGVAAQDASSSDEAPAACTTFTLFASPYSIVQDDGGGCVIRMDGFSNDGREGEPQLPHKIYNIALPRDVDRSTLRVDVVSSEESAIEGSFDIAPVTPLLPQLREGSASKVDEENLPGWRNTGVYDNDAVFPGSCVELLATSQMRQWNYARVVFTPIRYNPATKTLVLTESVTVRLSYERLSSQSRDIPSTGPVLESVASSILHNYDSAKEMYSSDPGSAPQEPLYDYVIITTNTIEANSTRLASFVSHKQSRGHSVLVITEDEFGGLTGQAPDNRAEKIRQWLINNCMDMGIEYVLLMGDPHPNGGGDGDIPMKMCWPRHDSGSYEECPTDYFYADLTGNWDIDGDQYYGEWADYYPEGGVDLAPEVLVGRIPLYDADYAALDSILQKMINYESSTDFAWRRSALLPMSFSDASTDGAFLAEQMKYDYLDTAGFSSWTMYQQGSACASADSAFSSDEELRSGSVTRNRWASDNFGIVCWWGHGSATGVYAGFSGCSDGCFFSSSDCSSLDDAHPSFTYQCSCHNGYPENSGNLQYALLRQGGIGTVGATRVSWYSPGQTNFAGSSTNAGLGYEYVRRLANGETAGQALFVTKQEAAIYSSTRLMNVYDMNLYGDPSTGIFSVDASVFQMTLSSGWNMVSVPVLGADMSAITIFAGADAVYEWNSDTLSYSIAETIEPQTGYWVASSSERTILVPGTPVADWTDSLAEGWNLIGSVHGDPVAVCDLADTPPETVQDDAIYHWNATTRSYEVATTIEQGKGYWATCIDACELTLGPPGG